MIFFPRSKGGRPPITGIKSEPFCSMDPEHRTRPVASADRQNRVALRQAYSNDYRTDETRGWPGKTPLKRVAGSVRREDQSTFKLDDRCWCCDLTRDDPSRQGRAKRRRLLDETYDGLCGPVEEEQDEKVGFMGPEDVSPGGLATAAPRPPPAKPRLAEVNPGPKPLRMVPFNAPTSKAKAGKLEGAHRPVFVYSAAQLEATIRIRFQASTPWADRGVLPSDPSHESQIEGTLWEETEVRPFQDGKSMITKGDQLATPIATKLENVLNTSGELFFVDLIQECWETFGPTFRPLSGGA